MVLVTLLALIPWPDGLGRFLTGTEAPWWSPVVGVIAGVLLTYVTSSRIEERRFRQAKEDRAEAERVRVRQEMLAQISEFDASVDAYRLASIRLWSRWAKDHPEMYDGTRVSLTQDEETAFLVIQNELEDLHRATRASYARLALQDLGQLSQAVQSVWNAYSNLTLLLSKGKYISTTMALQDALAVMRLVAKYIMNPRREDDSDGDADIDGDALLQKARKQVREERTVLGPPEGIVEIRVPDLTHGAIITVPTRHELEVTRAHMAVVDEFFDSGMSVAVFSVRLADGTTVVFGIGLDTEGQPKSNAPYRAETRDAADRGSLTDISIDDAGGIVTKHLLWHPGIGYVHPPQSVEEYEDYLRWVRPDPLDPPKVEIEITYDGTKDPQDDDETNR